MALPLPASEGGSDACPLPTGHPGLHGPGRSRPFPSCQALSHTARPSAQPRMAGCPGGPTAQMCAKPQLHIWLGFRPRDDGSTGASVATDPTHTPCRQPCQAAALASPGTLVQQLKVSAAQAAGLFQEAATSHSSAAGHGVSLEADGLHGPGQESRAPGTAAVGSEARTARREASQGSLRLTQPGWD